MNEKLKIREHNLESGEVIDREMTDAEYAQFEKDKAEFDAKKNAVIEAENKKKALLEKLGITEEEARLLIG